MRPAMLIALGSIWDDVIAGRTSSKICVLESHRIFAANSADPIIERGVWHWDVLAHESSQDISGLALNELLGRSATELPAQKYASDKHGAPYK